MINGRPETIISLTSFPEAIQYATEAIRSILKGSLLPDKVVLYLDTRKFPDGKIPTVLEKLRKESPIVEVRFDSEEIRSYKKLVPALKDFPDDIIVTIDDDIHYHRDMLRDLVDMHKRVPNAIIAHRVRKVRLDTPYSKWKKYKWYDFIFKKVHFSHLAMQTGVGGVLYPPNSLDRTMLDPALFMDMAPTNDDVWFWIAAVSQGTYVVPLPNGRNHVKGIGKPDKISLKKINLNSGTDRNLEALNKILEHYPEIKRKLREAK